MILPIHTYGEEILRQKAEDIDLNDVGLPTLISDMFETMHNANGAGLAAPQIGLNKRIFIVEEEIRPGELFKGVFINPKITFSSNHFARMVEGCLSFPSLSGWVERPYSIHLEWYDENKKFHSDNFADIEARIIQHEYDHLNGILYVDKINALDRLNMFMRLELIRNKQLNVGYKIYGKD